MKIKNIIIYGLGALILASSTSCKKRFDDMNVSPNDPENAPSQLLLANVIATTAYRMQLSAGLVVTDLWVQHTKANTYMNEDQYSPRTDRINTIWSNSYAVIFSDCLIAINSANEKAQPNNEAVGYIMKAYIGYDLTTLYGDVPYSQAGDPKKFILPVYDAQPAVLNALISDLDKAIALIGSTKFSTPLEELDTYDYIYKGDMQKWKKFANSLKLRVYLTLTTGGIDKTAEINSLLTSGDVMQSNKDNASMPYNTTTSNPIYQWISSSRKNDFKISATMVDYLAGSSTNLSLPADKRLTVFADTAVGGKYIGGINGDDPADPEIFSPLSTKSTTSFYNASSAFRFMTYAEVLFIAAEMDSTNASKYEAAVKASFSELGLTDADATAALADPKFAFNPANGGKLIGEQKWVALFGQGIEAYNSWRRTGYPKLKPAMLAATAGGVVPRRFPYESNERVLNAANSAAAAATLTPGVDIITAKVWFDRNHPVNFGNK
ncbi:MAG: SusD/RagB family nutrient-binding outer membrane lipoprotein [Bacteroidia bacterium]